ncbi:MAG: DNA alkylation repair protein [Ignavibacteria bacterium]|nr:DNA alkylation repair protein [Ignavibacteria bacterium]
MNEVEEILSVFEKNGKEENLKGMARYGIRFEKAFGCNIPLLRNLAKSYKNNHELALKLWKTRIHEARIMAFLIDDYEKVTIAQAENWLKDVKSWDICDGLCNNLLYKTPFAYKKAVEWTKRKDEFRKRAGFVMMAVLSVHDKKQKDETFTGFLEIISKHCDDDRNFVKKAVNWALRSIGKRNFVLNHLAIETAEQIRKNESKTSKWIANDALRELKNEKTMSVILRRENKLNVIKL